MSLDLPLQEDIVILDDKTLKQMKQKTFTFFWISVVFLSFLSVSKLLALFL